MLIQSCNIYLLPTCIIKGKVITIPDSKGRLCRRVFSSATGEIKKYYRIDVIKGSEKVICGI